MPTATRCCPAPACRLQVADPKYGEWLDVYLTILAPLPTPVGGMLGEPPVLSRPASLSTRRLAVAGAQCGACSCKASAAADWQAYIGACLPTSPLPLRALS